MKNFFKPWTEVVDKLRQQRSFKNSSKILKNSTKNVSGYSESIGLLNETVFSRLAFPPCLSDDDFDRGLFCCSSRSSRECPFSSVL